jgi:hypothetical protein
MTGLPQTRGFATWRILSTPIWMPLLAALSQKKKGAPAKQARAPSIVGARHRRVRLPLRRLKRELRRQLHRPRPAAAQERIPDAHIARRRQRQRAQTSPDRQPAGPIADPIRRRIRNERRQIWIRKVRMIEQVVRLKPQLQLQPLGDGRVLKDRQIKLPEVRPDQRISPFISEVEATRHTIRRRRAPLTVAPVESVTVPKIIPRKLCARAAPANTISAISIIEQNRATLVAPACPEHRRRASSPLIIVRSCLLYRPTVHPQFICRQHKIVALTHLLLVNYHLLHESVH